jgi:HEPN domain-containing protein
MKPPDEVRLELIGRWLTKADEDLAVAKQLLEDGVPYYAAIGFHAQQSAEKFIKAFLVSAQLEFPKTHDLRRLTEIVEQKSEKLAEQLRECHVLSDYGVDTRYPEDLPDLSREDAAQATKLAEQVRELVNLELKR